MSELGSKSKVLLSLIAFRLRRFPRPHQLHNSLQSLFHAQQSPQKSPPFPFLSLPFEIRLQIYDELLSHPQPIQIPNPSQYRNKSSSANRLHMSHAANFLRTCKQIDREAAPVLYGKNKFSFLAARRDSVFLDSILPRSRVLERMLTDALQRYRRRCAWRPRMYDFLKKIGPRNRRLLRHIIIHIKSLKACNTIIIPPTQPSRWFPHWKTRNITWVQDFANAFDLLGSSHSLETMELKFESHYAAANWFRSELGGYYLRRIKGIKELVCREVTYEGADYDFEVEEEIRRETKGVMEAGRRGER